MNQSIPFFKLFSDYHPIDAVAAAFSDAQVLQLDIDVVRRSISAQVHSPAYIPRRLYNQAVGELRDLYGMSWFSLKLTYPAGELSKVENEALLELFVSQNSMNRGSLAGAAWEWAGNTLTIRLRGNGKKALEESVPMVRLALMDQFGAQPEIVIEAGADLSGQALFDAMDAIRVSAMGDRPLPLAAKEKKTAAQGDHACFYGRPIKGTPIPMEQLDLNMGTVVVEGKIFALAHRELKKRNAWVINFDMTDNTGSIRVSRFMEQGQMKKPSF